MSATKETIAAAAKEFVNFINKSPSPFHAVDECRKRLLAKGFVELKEIDSWNIKPLDKCFLTRNQSCLVAFAVGGKFKPGNGFSMVGAHTDSPCLKIKPASKRVKQGYVQLGVQLYGGGIWHSWFDRDLKLAGRVMVRNQGKIDHRLVHIDRPILRIPNIAIHLQREQNEKFEFNKENHLLPILATTVREQLENESKPPSPGSSAATESSCQSDKHHSILTTLLSEELKVACEDILDFEICLADFVPGTIGGIFEEFIFAARLDNLHSCYCALEGLLASCENNNLAEETNVRMISLFDNEEVGSESAQGAASAIQEHILRRLSSGTGASPTAFEEAIPKSLMVSADMAHAVHPNYSDKHEELHRPALHKGVALKYQANQRYATTSITASILREIARQADVPLQDYTVRNDSSCGSTIGPIMSAKLGIPTIDLGSPQLSMHSIREMCCTSSVKQATDLFKGFFENYPKVFSSTTGI